MDENANRGEDWRSEDIKSPKRNPRGISLGPRRPGKVAIIFSVAAIVMLAVALHYMWPFLFPSEKVENSTPRLLQERGVEWRIVVEEPIPFGEVEPLITVFIDQVREVFGVRTYAVFYQHVPDDERLNYSEIYHAYAGFQPPARGTVMIPVYFLTGHGWRDGRGEVRAWARPTLAYYESPNDLVFGFTMFISEDMAFYPILTSTSSDTLITMLHEFGHNLGLKDLYWSNDSGIMGCESLPVVMATNAIIESIIQSHDLPPRYQGMIVNRTLGVSPGLDPDGPLTITRIEEAYLFNKTLRFLNYNLVTNRTKTWMSNATETIFKLSELRKLWTTEEASFIGMEGTFPYSCPQEFA